MFFNSILSSFSSIVYSRNNENVQIVNNIIQQISEISINKAYENYLDRAVIPFTIQCCYLAMCDIIDLINFGNMEYICDNDDDNWLENENYFKSVKLAEKDNFHCMFQI